MTDVAVGILRIRGPHAGRLARVAARMLPAALDRALADVDDVVVDRVEVRLAVDIDGCDDETLAVLWADAIRARVLAAGDGRTRRPVTPVTPAAEHAPLPVTGAPTVLAAARAWLAAAAAADPAAGRAGGHRGADALPRALLTLSDAAVARAVAAAAGPPEWVALMTRLGSALGVPPATDGPSPADGGHPPAPTPVAPLPSGPTSAPTPDDRPRRETEVLAAVAGLADLAAPHATAVDLATVTRAAGLVLLYPWLAEHCRRAEGLHPELDPLDVREAALAAVVDPDDRTLADDPLVRLLAGRPAPICAGPRRRHPPAHAPEVAQSALGVLASFTALIPGFERSTPAFIRGAWIARRGLVDTDRDPVLLLAATHPLDVVFPRLPYPVGLLRLPWSRPLSVRFRP
ncbi:hypothetical protein FHR83_006290 [Actinoplanes campanulatus]|uniref:Uncharacterized protein n=1 Tax=Actinoplanes campanulatus TaxID=113559 RepID=A0A7W5FHH3_9ACTN|nr:contractile injection system tape measure protein [Actinoplanes campanulatus]MBB3098591.1 hypothetical protein [Actinoplanes campanulatus]GGN36021.1 hypothetical protein GCM10010109_60590 [Actinoplanes campanulatus]GID39282.1 hypothetical protein Aca09nite_57880 [Actinoplanes campanulatus]